VVVGYVLQVANRPGHSKWLASVLQVLLNHKDLGDDDAMGALALARAGDKLRAQAFAERSMKRYPQHTLLRNYWMPTIRAAVLLANHNPLAAVHELDVTSTFEPGSSIWFYTAPLVPVYVRGQAFLAMNKGREAAAEFRPHPAAGQGGVSEVGVTRPSSLPLSALPRGGNA